MPHAPRFADASRAGESVRLASLDALRGLAVAAMLVVNDPGDWDHVYPWLRHATWHGLTPADVVFPLFLFIVGVALALRFDARLAAGVSPAILRGELLARALRLAALGLLLEAIAWLATDMAAALRFPGVLQRIAVTYALAGTIVLAVRGARGQWLVIGAVLGGYAWLLRGSVEPFTNLADRLDAALLGRHALVYDAATRVAHDPEGVLSSLPAACTVLLGVRAAHWLREGRTLPMAACAAGLLALGALTSLVVPLNKNLWTPSFALVTGGAAMLCLALAGFAIRRGWRPIGASLGRHAIAAYVLASLASVALEATGAGEAVYGHVFAPWGPAGMDSLASFAYALVFTGMIAAAVRLLDRRGRRAGI
jgi:predicted acyltransferase